MSTSSNETRILSSHRGYSHPTLEELVVKPAKRGELDEIFENGFQASTLYAMIPQLEDEFPGQEAKVGEWLSNNKPQWKDARDKHLWRELVMNPAKRGELDEIFVSGYRASNLYVKIPKLEEKFPSQQQRTKFALWLSQNKGRWKDARDANMARCPAMDVTPAPKAATEAATKDDGTPESAASDGTDAKIAFLNLKKERLAKEVEVLEMKIVDFKRELADLDAELGRLQISKEKKASDDTEQAARQRNARPLTNAERQQRHRDKKSTKTPFEKRVKAELVALHPLPPYRPTEEELAACESEEAKEAKRKEFRNTYERLKKQRNRRHKPLIEKRIRNEMLQEE